MIDDNESQVKKKRRLTSLLEIDRSNAWSSIKLGVDDLDTTKENMVKLASLVNKDKWNESSTPDIINDPYFPLFVANEEIRKVWFLKLFLNSFFSNPLTIRQRRVV